MADRVPKSPLLHFAQRTQPCGLPRVQCRGEDSNLCFIGERHLHVGAPLLAAFLAAAIVPWIVLYAVVLGSCGRWAASQWSHA